LVNRTDAKYKATSWDVGPSNIAQNHRYSGKGRAALYAGLSEKSVAAEMQHYGADASLRVMVSRQVEFENVLDLTNPSVREKLGVTIDQITSNDYSITHALGDMCQERFEAILVPSARSLGEKNLVVLPSGLKKLK
jgi:RES domain-containing protein